MPVERGAFVALAAFSSRAFTAPRTCKLGRLRARAAPRQRQRARWVAAATPPDGPVITQALEISFRNVWIRLMTSGVGEEYDLAIQNFVVASVAAYKAGYSVFALKLELAANERDDVVEGSDGVVRDTRLNEQEKETRLCWVALVYLTLARYGFPRDSGGNVREEFKGTGMEILSEGLAKLVESVASAADRGYDLQKYKMELSLNQDKDSKPLSAAELSIRSQWSRIVFSTINILPDDLRQRRR